MNTEWFDWYQSSTQRHTDIWELRDFLRPEIYTALEQEVQSLEFNQIQPTNLIAEMTMTPMCLELGGRLLPYMSWLLGREVKLTNIRYVVNLERCEFAPHLDGTHLAGNVQIYMPETDIDAQELGTWFCVDEAANAWARQHEADLQQGSMPPIEDSHWLLTPYRRNSGYLHLNLDRKIHRTRPVPQGARRPSLLFNYTLREGESHGIELEWYRKIGVCI